MGTYRQVRFVYLLVGWMLGAILLLTLFDAVSAGLFVLLSILGLLVATEATAPVNITPTWHGRLRWLTLIGLAVFTYLIMSRVFNIVG